MLGREGGEGGGRGEAGPMCSSAAEFAEDVLPSELHAPRRKPWEGEKKKMVLGRKKGHTPLSTKSPDS